MKTLDQTTCQRMTVHVQSGTSGAHPIINAYLTTQPNVREISPRGHSSRWARLRDLVSQVTAARAAEPQAWYHAHDLIAGVACLWAGGSKSLIYDAHEISYTFASNLWVRFFIYTLEWMIQVSAQKVVYPSPERKRAMRPCVLSKTKTYIIENLVTKGEVPIGISTAKEQEILRFSSENQYLNIFWGGLINEARGMTELIGAAELVARRTSARITISIYGQGFDCREHKSTSANVMINYYGTVGREELLSEMAGSDCAIAMYKPVNQNYRLCAPTKIFEYEALKLPYISNSSPYLERLVTEGRLRQCLMIDGCSVGSVANAMCDLLNKKYLYGTYANDRVVMQNTETCYWDDQKAEIERLYEG
jgi:hypothetical protein